MPLLQLPWQVPTDSRNKILLVNFGLGAWWYCKFNYSMPNGESSVHVYLPCGWVSKRPSKERCGRRRNAQAIVQKVAACGHLRSPQVCHPVDPVSQICHPVDPVSQKKLFRKTRIICIDLCRIWWIHTSSRFSCVCFLLLLLAQQNIPSRNLCRKDTCRPAFSRPTQVPNWRQVSTEKKIRSWPALPWGGCLL